MTSIEKLIAGIEEELEAAWQLPMSGGKVLVDTKNIMKMINEVKENLPMEIVQAKKIVQDRSEIIDRARAEAETSSGAEAAIGANAAWNRGESNADRRVPA